MRAGNALLDARAILAALDVPRGAHVADLGAGRTGHFALHAADVVGTKGRVYAVDILRDALAMITSSCALRGIAHVHTVWGDVERPHGVGLADASVDYAFFVHALHALTAWEDAAQEARRLVKPGGRIVVIDWHPLADHPVAGQVRRRVAPEEADVVFRRAGCDRYGAFAPSGAHWGRVYAVPLET